MYVDLPAMNNFKSLVVWLLVLVLLEVRGWKLVWEDQFNTLDTSKWDHEIHAWGGGNGEFQFYSDDPSNSYVRNGILYILPTLTVKNVNPQTGQPYGDQFLIDGVLDVKAMYGRCTMAENSGCWRQGQDIPPAMSARLRTAGRFSFTYGKVEVYAKMPVGDWLFPAIWMLPEDWEYGGWPRSGEVDIVEALGNPDLVSPLYGSYGIDRMISTLHWGPAWNNNKHYLTYRVKHNTTRNYGENFHLYAMEWDENGFRFSVDGEEILRRPDPPINQNPDWKGFWDYGQPWDPAYTNPWVNGSPMAPFDKKFHFLLNVAVGTTTEFIPDDLINRGGTAPKPWKNSDEDAMQKFWAARDSWYPTWQGEQAAMQVDYIRVYQRDEGAPTTPGSVCSSCPVGYEAPFTAGSSCYRFVTTGTNWWDAAYIQCQGDGGQLVSIETSEEQSHLVYYINSKPNLSACNYYWTSANDMEQEGSFVWLGTGQPLGYTAFAPGEPNNDEGYENCVELKKELGWLWNDANCHSTWPGYICEKQTSCN